MTPPVSNDPVEAAEQDIEGNCDAHFDVDVHGRPYNIRAICTNPIFQSAAEEAVSKVEFPPKIENGHPVERKNVVYPLWFRLEPDDVPVG